MLSNLTFTKTITVLLFLARLPLALLFIVSTRLKRLRADDSFLEYCLSKIVLKRRNEQMLSKVIYTNINAVLQYIVR